MNNETSTSSHPIGLYYHAKAGKYVGAIHEAQADAMVQQGFELVKEGLEAAMTEDPNHEAESAEQEVETAPAEPTPAAAPVLPDVVVPKAGE